MLSYTPPRRSFSGARSLLPREYQRARRTSERHMVEDSHLVQKILCFRLPARVWDSVRRQEVAISSRLGSI